MSLGLVSLNFGPFFVSVFVASLVYPKIDFWSKLAPKREPFLSLLADFLEVGGISGN